MTALDTAYIKSYCLDKDTDSEFFDLIADLLYTDEVQSLAGFVQHSTINRLDHITSVTYLSYILCKQRGLDFRAAARGAILHDLFYYDWHDGDWSHRPHGYRHPGFALKNARELNPQITKKEENIIKRHMFPLTPLPPPSPEGLIVSLADKYCATRELLIARGGYFTVDFYDKLGSERAKQEEKQNV